MQDPYLERTPRADKLTFFPVKKTPQGNQTQTTPVLVRRSAGLPTVAAGSQISMNGFLKIMKFSMQEILMVTAVVWGWNVLSLADILKARCSMYRSSEVRLLGEAWIMKLCPSGSDLIQA